MSDIDKEPSTSMLRVLYRCFGIFNENHITFHIITCLSTAIAICLLSGDQAMLRTILPILIFHIFATQYLHRSFNDRSILWYLFFLHVLEPMYLRHE